MLKNCFYCLFILSFISSEVLGADFNYLTSIKNKATTNSIRHSDTLLVDIDLNSLINKDVVNKKNKLAIHLNDGKEVKIFLKKIINNKDKNNFSWIGKDATKNTIVILSVRNGILSGSIDAGKNRYIISYINGSYNIIKKDINRSVSLKNDMVFKKNKNLPFLKHNKQHNNLLSRSNSTTPVTIRVLLFYTKSFKDKYGVSTESNLQNIFDYAITAYEQSDTKVDLELAALEMIPEDLELNDITSVNNDGLDNLTDDGYVFFKKVEHQADMVSLIIPYDGGNYCGLAWTPYQVSHSSSYSLVAYGSTNEGYYCERSSLSHEMGHNFGCAHDIGHSGTAIYPYGHGYDIPGTFATIMSYDNPGIQYFSNPNITHNGHIIGNANSADNARVIRENRFKMEQISDDLNMDLESTDSINDYDIVGTLYKNEDLDAYYNIKLGGETTISGENIGYYNWFFYVDIYDSKHNLVISNDGGSNGQFTHIFANGEYTLVIKKGDWQGNSANYNLTISTNYVEESGIQIESISSNETTEGNNLIHTVTLNSASNSNKEYAFTINLNTVEADDIGAIILSGGVTYNQNTNKIIVPKNIQSFTITIPTIDDEIDENSESYTIYAGEIEATGTIIDNDTATITSITNSAVEEGGELVHIVSLNKVADYEKIFEFTLNREDIDGTDINIDNIVFSNGVIYNQVDDEIVIPANIDSFTITIPTIDDEIDENSESYTINIEELEATGTIIDNDTVIVKSITNATVLEGNDLIHSVTLNQMADHEIKLDYMIDKTNIQNKDIGTTTFSNSVIYNETTSKLVIPKNVKNFTITTPTVNDALDEDLEFYTIHLEEKEAIGKILDDDENNSLKIDPSIIMYLLN